MTQGYDGPLPGYYVQSSNPQTPNLGLTLIGVDPIIAYNFVLIDMFAGATSGVTSLNGLAGAVTLAAGSNITITPTGNTLTIASTAAGAVTSVGLTMPAIFSVANSPITSSGTLAVTLATETANTVWAGPTTGAAAAPTFRALVSADLPAGVGTVTSVTFTGDGTVLSSTPSSAVTTTGTLTAALANAAGGTLFGRNATTTGAPAYTTAPVLGIPGTSTGTIALASSTASGKFIITAPASASTPTLTLPTTSNVLAGQFAGDGVIYSASLVTASAAGTLTLPSPSNQNANIVFAGPASGGAATPSFRALVAADIASGTVLWNTLGNASGALTLANGTNASTFNHTSAVVWTWANTTSAVVGTPQNSPSLVLSGQYFATGNITGTDTWTIAQSLTAGLNGASALTITHAGTTGSLGLNIPVSGTTGVPNIFSATSGAGCGIHVGPAANISAVICNNASQGDFLRFNQTTTLIAQIGQTSTTSHFFRLATSEANSVAGVIGNVTTSVIPGVTFGGGSSFTGTGAGTQTAVSVGSSEAVSGNAFATVTFAPTSGATNFTAFRVLPTINQTSTSSGNYTGLLVNVIETSLKGSANLLLDLQAGATGGTSEFAVNNSGVVTKYAATTTVGQGIPSEIGTVVDSTAQSAAITATNIIASAPRTGMYRISMSATITTASSTSSILGGTNGFQVGFTSPTDSVAKTTVAGNSITTAANTTGTAIADTITVYAKTGTAITYAFDYQSTGVTAMVYELHARLEAL